jgi:DNA-binding beta-propeller fold protein YncE
VLLLKSKNSMARVKYFILVALALLIFCLGNSRKENPAFLGPVDMVYFPGQKKLFIAESCGKKIDVFDIGKRTVASTLPLSDQPNNLFITMDQKMLLVSQGMDDGRLLVYDLEKLKRKKDIPAGHSPTAIAESREHIIICNRFPGEITFLDKDKFRIDKIVKVGREPIAIEIVPDKNKLFVAHHLPEMASTADHVAAKISVIDLGSFDVTNSILLPNGSSSVKDITLDREGKYLLVTHILARYQLPPTQLERGWMNTNAFSIIDVEMMKCSQTILLDDIDHGAANPWDLDFSADGQRIFVSHAGTHEISIIDWKKMEEALGQTGNTSPDYATSENIGFIYPYRKRLAVQGNGPRVILSDGEYLFVANYFSDNLSMINLENFTEQNIQLGESNLSDERLGEMYFHDASLCFQSWQSCVSCHPDARVDGLNWDLLNDGVGNPKNVKSLLLSHKTPPVMSLGVRSHAKLAVRSGFKYIQFAEVSEAYSSLVDVYLEGLKPLQSPHQSSSGDLENGKALFQSLRCNKCHPGPLFTDLKSYPLGEDKSLLWDTPTLIELWRTGPYWHDGKYATLEEVFAKEKHGLQVSISCHDIKALNAYLQNL